MQGQLKLVVCSTASRLTATALGLRWLPHFPAASPYDPAHVYLKVSLYPNRNHQNQYKSNPKPVRNGEVTLHETFTFDVSPMECRKRLLVSVRYKPLDTNQPTIFIGCTSFGLQKIIDQREVKQGWFCLLSEAVGKRKHLSIKFTANSKTVGHLKNSIRTDFTRHRAAAKSSPLYHTLLPLTTASNSVDGCVDDVDSKEALVPGSKRRRKSEIWDEKAVPKRRKLSETETHDCRSEGLAANRTKPSSEQVHRRKSHRCLASSTAKGKGLESEMPDKHFRNRAIDRASRYKTLNDADQGNGRSDFSSGSNYNRNQALPDPETNTCSVTAVQRLAGSNQCHSTTKRNNMETQSSPSSARKRLNQDASPTSAYVSATYMKPVAYREAKRQTLQLLSETEAENSFCEYHGFEKLQQTAVVEAGSCSHIERTANDNKNAIPPVKKDLYQLLQPTTKGSLRKGNEPCGYRSCSSFFTNHLYFPSNVREAQMEATTTATPNRSLYGIDFDEAAGDYVHLSPAASLDTNSNLPCLASLDQRSDEIRSSGRPAFFDIGSKPNTPSKKQCLSKRLKCNDSNQETAAAAIAHKRGRDVREVLKERTPNRKDQTKLRRVVTSLFGWKAKSSKKETKYTKSPATFSWNSSVDNALSQRTKEVVKDAMESHRSLCFCSFSDKTLVEALGNEDAAEAFMEFLRSEYSEENLEFWKDCDTYKNLKDLHRPQMANKIYSRYVAVRSQNEINIDREVRQSVKEKLEAAPADLFDHAQRAIFTLMSRDPYQRFQRSLLRKCSCTP